MGTSGTRSGGLTKGQSPCELLGGLLGFLSLGCRSLRPCVGSGPEPEDSSPVLTWILGYFWSLPRGVSPCIESGHACVLSSRAAAAVSRFQSRGSRDLWLSLEPFPRGFPTWLSHVAFPRGFPTGLSHVPPWCESILGVKVDAVQGKEDPLEWTETSGRLLEWWHDAGVPLDFPVESPTLEMRRERREIFPEQAGKGYLMLSYEAEMGLLWMWPCPSCFH